MNKIKDENIAKWIDLSKLPKLGDNDRICWSKSIGCMMDFVYGDISGKIKILEKVDSTNYKVAFYIGEEIIEYYYQPHSIIKCHFGRALKKPIAITHPEYIKYFVNENEAYLYSAYSSYVIKAKCPTCGHEREISISVLVRQGLACPMCSDGISYSNKLMYNILSQLHIDFKKEVGKNHNGFEWAKNYLYDFYFENNMNKYFIEMDGGFHYGNGFLPYEESYKIDEIKNMLAKEHGINIIRINCNYCGINKRFNFIKNNILNSELSIIFDLSHICWEDANKSATKSNIKLAADLWNTTEYCTQEIADRLGLYVNTARRYLRNAADLGLCNYNKKDAYSRSFKRKDLKK